MKTLLFTVLILIAGLSSAETQLEYLYGGNGPDAIEKCIQSRIDAYIEVNNHLPVIDVAELRDKYREECTAMSKTEMPDKDPGSIYESTTNDLPQALVNEQLALFTRYNIKPNQFFDFYADNKKEFLVVGVAGAVTLSLINKLDKLPLGGVGKLLRVVGVAVAGVGATSATAYQVNEGDMDFQNLRRKIVAIMNQTRDHNKRLELTHQLFTTEQLDFLLQAQSDIIESEFQNFTKKCANIPNCEIL